MERSLNIAISMPSELELDEDLDDSDHKLAGINSKPSSMYDRALLEVIVMGQTLVLKSKHMIILCSILILISLTYYAVILYNRNVDEKIILPSFRDGQTQIYNITIFGDSLASRPYHKYNLHFKIRSNLKLKPNENVKFLTFAHNGDSIERLRDKVDEALKYNSTGLIMFWDSDFDSPLLIKNDKAYDIRYKINLRYVMKHIMDYGTDIITVAGPGTYKEGYYDATDSKVLDKYNKINENVCAEYSVPYTNFRKALKDDFPWYWFLSKYYSTIDGQHPNRHGTDILAGLFAKHINSWLEKKRSIASAKN